MTRANILIISDYNKFKLQVSGDGQLEEMILPLLRYKDARDYFNLDLKQFCIDIGGVRLGHVANPYYYYDLNLDIHEVKAWEATKYWVNAPKNWRERGWNCYLGENGKYGYHNWRKGPVIYDSKTNPMYYKGANGLYIPLPELKDTPKNTNPEKEENQMGNRGSISVFNQQTGRESIVLFRHICGDLQGMEALIEEAVFTDNENIFSRQEPPEIIAHLCAVSVKQIGIATYLGKDTMDGDNTDNGHFKLVLKEDRMWIEPEITSQTEWHLKPEKEE